MATIAVQPQSAQSQLDALWTLFMSQTEAVRRAFTLRIIEMRNDDVATDAIHAAPMPCAFTDEEWEQELIASMKEGDATVEETKQFYDKWGIAM